MAGGSSFLATVRGVIDGVSRLGLRIGGVEVTQGIQFFDAVSHLTDPADRGPDNSVRLVADKPAWVRVYVESGLLGPVEDVRGSLEVEREGVLEWQQLGTMSAIGSGALEGSVVADSSLSYAQVRGSLANSLNFVIPREWMRGRLRLTARITVRGGAVRDERAIEIDASLLQTLRVRGIPVRYWGPDASGNNVQLSEPGLAQFQSTLAWACLTYPVSSTPAVSLAGTFTWSEPLTGTATNGGCTTSWNDLNFWLKIARVVDGNQPGLVYLALLPAGIPIGGVSGCGYAGAIAAARDTDGVAVAHEMGHFLGFSHAPCGSVGTSADPNYPAYEPYDTVANRTASIGEYGLNVSNGSILPPNNAKDFMSYCSPPWTSLYHYQMLLFDDYFDPRLVGIPPRWWDDYVDYVPQLIPQRNLPDPPPWDANEQILEPEPVIAILGTLDVDGTVDVRSVSRLEAIRWTGGTSTALRAELVNEAGAVLAQGSVNRLEGFGGCTCGGGCAGGENAFPTAFQAMIPNAGRGAALRIVHGAEERWRREATGGPGRPHLDGARVEDGDLVVRWHIEGETGLEHWLRWSNNAAKSWQALHLGGPAEEIRTPAHVLPSGEIQIQVLVHDGFATEISETVSVAIPTRSPTVAILHPRDGETLAASVPLRLWGFATSSDGAQVAGDRCRWLLNGKEVADGHDVWVACPPEGRHQVTLTAADEHGEASATVEFDVTRDGRRPMASYD